MVSFVKCIILKLKQNKRVILCTVKPALVTNSIKHDLVLCNKNVDIKISAHDAFPE